MRPSPASGSWLAVLLTLAFRASEALAAEPSFSCAKATTRHEKLICADEALARDDRALGERYQRRLKECGEPARGALRTTQRAWLANRASACPPELKDRAAVACLQKQYEQRLTELRQGEATPVCPGFRTQQGQPASDALRAFVVKAEQLDAPEPLRLDVHEVDLNRDGRPESLVYLRGPETCGNAGCNLLMVEGGGGRPLRIHSRMTLANYPLIVSEAAAGGWRDLVIQVAGGGVSASKRVLRYNGKRYPSNPSTQPEAPLPLQGVQLLPREG